MRSLLILLASVLLASCWAGAELYADSDSRPVLKPGLYRMTDDDRRDKVVRVSILPSGLTRFEGEEKESYGFVPLDPGRGIFIAWYDADDGKRPVKPNQAYALMRREKDGSFIVYAPSCKEAEAEIARQAGATVEPGMYATCTFPTRASLEKAMRRVQFKDDGSTIKLAYIGK